MMRISTYEIILPLVGGDDNEIEGKGLLVNGLYGAMDVVDAGIADKVCKGDLGDIPVSVRERLALRGHITTKSEEEEAADARLLGRVWTKLMSYSVTGPVILPTYDCNFRCPYCFERHRLSNGQEWLSRAMKPEMVEAVFAGLQKLRDKGNRIEGVSLYGGEPFLKENRETVRNICEHSAAMGLKLSAITNGYDLDSCLDLLDEFDFTDLQITVDGVGRQNDCRRLHRDGLPTYERIMQNVALALEHGVNVKLRVNVNAENIDGIKELVEDLKKRGLHMLPREELKKLQQSRKEAKEAGQKQKGQFFYYFKAVSEDVDSPTRVTEKQVLDAIIDTGFSPFEAMDRQSQYSMPMQGLIDAMEKEDYPKFSPAYCGAEQGMLCIGPDGMIYPCWDLVAMKEEAVGFTDIETGRFLFDFGKAKWRTRTSDLMEPCRTCPYIFICRGGCAPEAKRTHGSYFRENCGERKEIFAYVASRAAGKKWEETKEDELSISLTGPLSRLSLDDRNILMTSISQKEILEVVSKAGFSFTSDDKG